MGITSRSNKVFNGLCRPVKEDACLAHKVDSFIEGEIKGTRAKVILRVNYCGEEEG